MFAVCVYVGDLVAQEQGCFRRHAVEYHPTCDISRRTFMVGLLGGLGCAGVASLSGCAFPARLGAALDTPTAGTIEPQLATVYDSERAAKRITLMMVGDITKVVRFDKKF